MLDIIHLILSLLNLSLIIIYIILWYKPYKKNYFDKLKNFRTKFILSLIICALYFVKTIISFFLLSSFLSIIASIGWFILWLYITILNYRNIKEILSEDNKIIYLSEKDIREIE